MSKKKQSLTFDTLMAFVSSDTQEAMTEEGIKRVALSSLRPDPAQPRQLLPDDLQEALANDEEPKTIVERWIAYGQSSAAPPAQRHHIQELVRLADSIAQHGLVNPVTIRTISDEIQDRYLIVTGERRYWAYVLLNSQNRPIRDGEQERSADRIPAIITPVGAHIRAHQLVENLLREDMNAIEKAQGIWALRQELSDVTHGLQRGKKQVPWKDVEKALGMSRQHRIRLISVLDLPSEGQQLVSQHQLSERLVRPIIHQLKGRSDLQIAALKQTVMLQSTSTDDAPNLTRTVQTLVERLLQAEEPPTPAVSRAEARISRVYNQLTKSGKVWRKLDDTTMQTVALQIAQSRSREQTVQELQQMREQIDALLQTVAQASQVNEDNP